MYIVPPSTSDTVSDGSSANKIVRIYDNTTTILIADDVVISWVGGIRRSAVEGRAAGDNVNRIATSDISLYP